MSRWDILILWMSLTRTQLSWIQLCHFPLNMLFWSFIIGHFELAPDLSQTIPLVLLVTLVPIYWQTTTNQGSTTVETGSDTLKSFTHGSCWISWFTANRLMSNISHYFYSQSVQQILYMLYDSFDRDENVKMSGFSQALLALPQSTEEIASCIYYRLFRTGLRSISNYPFRFTKKSSNIV